MPHKVSRRELQEASLRLLYYFHFHATEEAPARSGTFRRVVLLIKKDPPLQRVRQVADPEMPWSLLGMPVQGALSEVR
jgi:hypothetical protein